MAIMTVADRQHTASLPSKPPSQPLPAPPARSKLTTFGTNSTRARVLVGPEKVEYFVDRTLLSAVSPAFRDGLDASSENNKHHHIPCIWLATEAPVMFELFVIWLHHRSSFRSVLDGVINGRSFSHYDENTPPMTPTSPRAQVANSPDLDSLHAQKIHWGLVRLHLFAARLSLFQLQDTAIDALQDLYLARDWDVTPRLIRFLYFSSVGGSDVGVRMRRWAVAMVAWQLAAVGADPDMSIDSNDSFEAACSASTLRIANLFLRCPAFKMDYVAHVNKMTASGLTIQVKNPQLRMPTNKLRSDERVFAFRHCSFHSHRAAVGEKQCPHVMRAKRGIGSLEDTAVVDEVPLAFAGELGGYGQSGSGIRRPRVNELEAAVPMDHSVLAAYMQQRAIL